MKTVEDNFEGGECQSFEVNGDLVKISEDKKKVMLTITVPPESEWGKWMGKAACPEQQQFIDVRSRKLMKYLHDEGWVDLDSEENKINVFLVIRQKKK